MATRAPAELDRHFLGQGWAFPPAFGNGGARNYGNAFLPAIYQGTRLGQGRQPLSQNGLNRRTSMPGSAATTSRKRLSPA